MKKDVLVLLVIFSVIATSSIFAQEGGSVAAREKKYDVNLAPSAINFAPAQLDTVIFREGKKLREEFQLSFANFAGIAEVWKNSRLILIGYNKDGTPSAVSLGYAEMALEKRRYPKTRVGLLWA